jgi:hypothetical protein
VQASLRDCREQAPREMEDLAELLTLLAAEPALTARVCQAEELREEGASEEASREDMALLMWGACALCSGRAALLHQLPTLKSATRSHRLTAQPPFSPSCPPSEKALRP